MPEPRTCHFLINQALRAGARCVEYGDLLDDETIELLLAHDAFLVPTLVTYEQPAETGRRYGLGEASYRKIDDVRQAGLGALEKAHKTGANLVYGSDLLGPTCTPTSSTSSPCAPRCSPTPTSSARPPPPPACCAWKAGSARSPPAPTPTPCGTSRSWPNRGNT
ncbi:hypothetical protein ACFQ9J_03625 [Streptomyces sp. NPDC056529]|uniref:hypothetical protein n=1 Tax=Streptomyces sp. NPDC056529 TaxID=3345855 RepID=UPI003676F42C